MLIENTHFCNQRKFCRQSIRVCKINMGQTKQPSLSRWLFSILSHRGMHLRTSVGSKRGEVMSEHEWDFSADASADARADGNPSSDLSSVCSSPHYCQAAPAVQKARH